MLYIPDVLLLFTSQRLKTTISRLIKQSKQAILLAMKNIDVSISVPFPTGREAEIAYKVLNVDSEPRRSGVEKVLGVDGNVLNAKFTGEEARKVRVGLTSFFDSLTLVTQTMSEFGPPEPVYSHYH
ncbi:EKC/KEOPS complex subunit LAGE3 [Diachasma alloeum]|uniref:EKC/KEOPS complex subunit LAGE3 n=1 Tax=Diachasma alloeum TaxID=454923 RepID=UPI0007383BB2|nr:EKC/KEOPS complex subunit LAGE3 [Diachasma alloeum]